MAGVLACCLQVPQVCCWVFERHVPGAGTSLPNLRDGKNLHVAASHRCDIPCRAEKGSSRSSQAGDENGSPGIPLLLLTGWVPGDVDFSTTMVCLPPQAGLRSRASSRPAQPLPVSQWEFSTGARLFCCTTLPKPRLQGQFFRTSGRLILGMLTIIGLSAALLKTPLVQMSRPDLHAGQPGVPESGQYQNQ